LSFIEQPDDYKELTAQEEKDVEELLAACDWAVMDVDVLSKRLTEELAAIEAACILT
jgi:hypothetical protein